MKLEILISIEEGRLDVSTNPPDASANLIQILGALELAKEAVKSGARPAQGPAPEAHILRAVPPIPPLVN